MISESCHVSGFSSGCDIKGGDFRLDLFIVRGVEGGFIGELFPGVGDFDCRLLAPFFGDLSVLELSQFGRDFRFKVLPVLRGVWGASVVC